MGNTNFQGIMPEKRLSSLRNLIKTTRFVRIMEAHNGLTGRIVETVSGTHNGVERSFDGMWISSLCDSTAKAKPDIELVDFSSRQNTIEQILDVTTKPIILDGDTGGKIEHLTYHIRTLERLGVSAIIIEDKVGLKKNSLFGTDVEQEQDSIKGFSDKISAVKNGQMTEDFMCIARVESLILSAGMEDALTRSKAYIKAGADGIMIHSKEKTPDEILEFLGKFKSEYPQTPVVVVPSSYSSTPEDELKTAGANIVIYANQFIRSAYPAMVNTARCILEHQRASEADYKYCMSIKEILRLIPDSL